MQTRCVYFIKVMVFISNLVNKGFSKKRYGLKFDILSQRIRLYVNITILSFNLFKSSTALVYY